MPACSSTSGSRIDGRHYGFTGGDHSRTDVRPGGISRTLEFDVVESAPDTLLLDYRGVGEQEELSAFAFDGDDLYTVTSSSFGELDCRRTFRRTPAEDDPLSEPPYGLAFSRRAPAELIGTWRTDCVPAPDGVSVRTSYVIETDRLRLETNAYDDERCTVPYFDLETDLVTWYRDTITMADGSRAIEVYLLFVGEARMTLRDETLSEELTRAGACGIERWDAGAEYDIGLCSDLSDALPSLGRLLPQILSAQGDVLYIGGPIVASSAPLPTRGPTRLDCSTPFVRVEP